MNLSISSALALTGVQPSGKGEGGTPGEGPAADFMAMLASLGLNIDPATALEKLQASSAEGGSKLDALLAQGKGKSIADALLAKVGGAEGDAQEDPLAALSELLSDSEIDGGKSPPANGITNILSIVSNVIAHVQQAPQGAQQPGPAPMAKPSGTGAEGVGAIASSHTAGNVRAIFNRLESLIASRQHGAEQVGEGAQPAAQAAGKEALQRIETVLSRLAQPAQQNQPAAATALANVAAAMLEKDDRRTEGAQIIPISGIAAPAMPTVDTAASVDTTAALPADKDVSLRAHLDLAKDSAWLDTLARDISRMAGRENQLHFKLNPEHLGSLTIDLVSGANGTSVRMTADTEAARAILADAQPKLIAEARAQGLRISEAHVDLGGQGGTRQQPDPVPFVMIRTDDGSVAAEVAQEQPGASGERYA